MADWWLDVVYLIDMVRIFSSPFTNDNGKLVYNKKQIALKYFKSYFFFDMFAFYPIGFLRSNSEWKDGSLDDT